MKEKDTAINTAEMGKPSCQLLLTTPMAAIMLSGKDASELSGLLASIGPIYTAAANDTQGDIKEVLLAVSFVLQGSDSIIDTFFGSEDEKLNFDRMMVISATGADFWMCKLSDGEIGTSDLIKLFKAIQAGLIETVGDLREENKMIDQLIQVQDQIIEHISSLN
ncbi:MAG: hypothetical protein KAT25_02325 [Sulfuriflexus sp.]|nr:hypothetical protein [Sulfuriflexus sp.]